MALSLRGSLQDYLPGTVEVLALEPPSLGTVEVLALGQPPHISLYGWRRNHASRNQMEHPPVALPSTDFGKKHQGTSKMRLEKQHFREAHSSGLMPGDLHDALLRLCNGTNTTQRPSQACGALDSSTTSSSESTADLQPPGIMRGCRGQHPLGPPPTGTVEITLLREGVETPGDPTDRGVETASIVKALVTGDPWEAAVLPVMRTHPGALAGGCGKTPISPASVPQPTLRLLSGEIKKALKKTLCFLSLTGFLGPCQGTEPQDKERCQELSVPWSHVQLSCTPGRLAECKPSAR
ncbi:hypothetical protein P7K49_032590, partial [Saguinus oedipus]